jgi:hypothetical protein
MVEYTVRVYTMNIPRFFIILLLLSPYFHEGELYYTSIHSFNFFEDDATTIEKSGHSE